MFWVKVGRRAICLGAGGIGRVLLHRILDHLALYQAAQTFAGYVADRDPSSPLGRLKLYWGEGRNIILLQGDQQAM